MTLVYAAAPASAVNDGAGPRLRYLDVADQLMTEIAEGRYEIGQKLPTEAQLCERFGVSRSTVRQALAEVELAGLVERRQGSGTTLVARRRVLRYVLSVTSEGDILRYAAETVLELSGPAQAVLLADGRRLQLGDPTRWCRWRGIRREASSGPPIGLTSVYLPRVYAGAMKHVGGHSRRAIFEVVTDEYGLTLTRIDQAISATVLDDREARLLQSDAGGPAIAITRRYMSADGLIEVSENIHPADRFSYELRLERESFVGRTGRS